MEDLQRCASCKCKKIDKAFSYGLASCDKCIDKKRIYNQKKAEEIARLYPKTFCEACQMYFRDVNWDKHSSSKRHEVSLKKQMDK